MSHSAVEGPDSTEGPDSDHGRQTADTQDDSSGDGGTTGTPTLDPDDMEDKGVVSGEGF